MQFATNNTTRNKVVIGMFDGSYVESALTSQEVEAATETDQAGSDVSGCLFLRSDDIADLEA